MEDKDEGELNTPRGPQQQQGHVQQQQQQEDPPKQRHETEVIAATQENNGNNGKRICRQLDYYGTAAHASLSPSKSMKQKSLLLRKNKKH